MKLLLDTHTFIWWDSSPVLISPSAQAALTDPGNMLFLSTASVWEMVIKAELGKLSIRASLDVILDEQVKRNGVQLLGIEPVHALAVRGLPMHHKDPFDRLLIAQALVEHATLVTADKAIAAYSVPQLW